jgi:hypothetical protein
LSAESHKYLFGIPVKNPLHHGPPVLHVVEVRIKLKSTELDMGILCESEPAARARRIGDALIAQEVEYSLVTDENRIFSISGETYMRLAETMIDGALPPARPAHG